MAAKWWQRDYWTGLNDWRPVFLLNAAIVFGLGVLVGWLLICP